MRQRRKVFMDILKVEKVEGGYNVYLKDSDMVVFTHKKDEIEGLKKAGFIKTEKKLKTRKKK